MTSHWMNDWPRRLRLLIQPHPPAAGRETFLNGCGQKIYRRGSTDRSMTLPNRVGNGFPTGKTLVSRIEPDFCRFRFVILQPCHPGQREGSCVSSAKRKLPRLRSPQRPPLRMTKLMDETDSSNILSKQVASTPGGSYQRMVVKPVHKGQNCFGITNQRRSLSSGIGRWNHILKSICRI